MNSTMCEYEGYSKHGRYKLHLKVKYDFTFVLKLGNKNSMLKFVDVNIIANE
jgi:hypothetical protein